MTSSDDLYLRVREKEGRLYSDEMVARLPDVPADHPLRAEWQARAGSLERLSRYVGRLAGPLRILDLGTGNGWMAHRLERLRDVRVWGVDRGGRELTQAARLFNGDKLAFVDCDIFRAPFPNAAFDLIIIASAIQYFEDLPGLVHALRPLLCERGDLHIIDSPLYRSDDVQAAQQRTQAYYEGLGLPEMSARYFHHTFEELEPFSPRWLYRPSTAGGRLAGLLGKTDSPFPWLCIGK